MNIKISKIAEKYAKLKFRFSEKPSSISFSNLSSDYKGCLVCMPGNMENTRAASEILPELAETFPNRDIRILITSNIDSHTPSLIKKFAVIRPEPHDLDRFSLPRREFIGRLTRGGLSVAMDLDPQPNFFNAVISLQSGAPVRTAFDKGEGLPYYNFIIGVAAMDVAPKVSYRAMIDILKNFRR